MKIRVKTAISIIAPLLKKTTFLRNFNERLQTGKKSRSRSHTRWALHTHRPPPILFPYLPILHLDGIQTDICHPSPRLRGLLRYTCATAIQYVNVHAHHFHNDVHHLAAEEHTEEGFCASWPSSRCLTIGRFVFI